MELADYLARAPRGTAAHIARQMGVTSVTVGEWASKKKPIPVERCTTLEAACVGAVMRWDMRDDWHVHWPELRRHPLAPKFKTAAEAA